MIITGRELRNDTYNFLSKQMLSIVFISVCTTLITIFIDMFIQPDMHIISIIENNTFINTHSVLELINNMNLEEKYKLLKYSVLKIIELLMTKTLLLVSIINLIFYLSTNRKKSVVSSVSSFFSLLPNLFILNFLSTCIIQLGFMIFFVPGVVLSILLSLSPIIFAFKKHNLVDSIRMSMYTSCNNIKIIGTGVLFWMLGKFFLTILLLHIDFINKNIIFLILSISTNILYSILIIYLFRFYMIFSRS